MEMLYLDHFKITEVGMKFVAKKLKCSEQENNLWRKASISMSYWKSFESLNIHRKYINFHGKL